jgi:TRAP-type C4-dicarboxylate transport system substrate-binding protein
VVGATALTALMIGGQANALTIKGNEITLRMGSGHPPFITYVKFMSKYFAPNVAKRVAAETKYKIKFKEHYSGTVVKVFDTLEGVQDGRLDIGGWCVCFDDDKAMAMNITYFVPFGEPDGNKNLKIMNRLIKEFPELYQDYEKRYKQKLLAQTGFANYGLLTAFDWKTFGDLKGHKILAAGPNLPWVKGGIPVRTTIPKAAQKLQTGVGEGIVLFPDTDFKLKLHEATKGGTYTVTDFSAAVQISLTMNLRTRSKLPKEVVKIIDEEAVKWSVASMAQSVKDHQWGLDKLKGAGLKIRTIDPAAQKAWAVQLKDWPNERAQAVKAKKGIDMPKIMRAYMKYSEQGGHKYPHRYVIK